MTGFNDAIPVFGGLAKDPASSERRYLLIG